MQRTDRDEGGGRVVEQSTQPGTPDPGALGFTFREDPAEDPYARTTEVPRVVPPPASPAPPAHRARRNRSTIVAVIASGVAVLALAVAGWLWYVADSWQEQATDLKSQEAQARADAAVLQGERDDARAQLEQRTTELAETTTQLDAANVRVSELANEKAQATDQQAVATQLAQQAAQIATGLQQCSEGQTQLIGYVTAAPGAYDANQIVAFAQQVQGACAAARAANDQLAALVARLGG